MTTAGLKCGENDITPVISAAVYSAGNQVGGIQALTHASIEENRITQLQTLNIIDVDNQKAAMTVLFFNQPPVVSSTDKTAFAITAANAKAQCIGQIQVLAANYATVGSVAVATLQFTNYFTQSLTSTAGNIYAIAVTSGTPTYTTTSSLVFKYVFAQHF